MCRQVVSYEFFKVDLRATLSAGFRVFLNAGFKVILGVDFGADFRVIFGWILVAPKVHYKVHSKKLIAHNS